MASPDPSTPNPVPQVVQRRMRASDRVEELVSKADAAIRMTRSADLSLRSIADSLGISRALIYAYFDDRNQMLNAVLDRHFGVLDAAGFSRASNEGGLMHRAEACGAILLEHVLKHGATVELVLREEGIARQLNGPGIMGLRRVQRMVSQAAMVELRMGLREAVAFVELVTVIPLEAARRVDQDGVSRDVAHNVCQRLIRSSIEAQIPHSSAAL